MKKREPAGKKDKKQKESLGICKHELKKTELETSALKKKKIKLIGVPGVDERLDLLGLFFFFFGASVVTCSEIYASYAYIYVLRPHTNSMS